MTRKVWIELDMVGAAHVMIHDLELTAEPFCYCSFHYSGAYTDNATRIVLAQRMAEGLGATGQIEVRTREII
ncbi:MAG: hypothetical protein WCF45_10725 [Photobacterium halotolerans]